MKKYNLIYSLFLMFFIFSVLNAEVEKHHDHAEHAEHTKKEEIHHDDHGKKDRHDEHEEGTIELTSEQLKLLKIKVDTIKSGKIKKHITLPGEIVPNGDFLAHIVPKVPGVVKAVNKNLGDLVKEGEVLAILDSRDLADVKSDYLSNLERFALAESNFIREKDLWNKKISSEQIYLEAKQNLAEAKIELQSSKQKLNALGLTNKDIKQISNENETVLTQYKIVAPFDGTIIEKHITLGEYLKDDSELFVISDLSTVWVNLSVYQKDLHLIKPDLPALISAGSGIENIHAKISYLSPIVDEKTRTAMARVILKNETGFLRPGLFVTASIATEHKTVGSLVLRSALQKIESQTCVFIQTDHGFKSQPVEIGLQDEHYAEILSGIHVGQKYVSHGAFTLKAELAKGSFGDGHNH